MRVATKTIAAINAALEQDQGAAYRKALQKILPTIGDAYRGLDPGYREHLGASVIGDSCARKLWYQFNWALPVEKHEGRVLRLFNRGHLEEGRVLALLETAGMEVHSTVDGKQIKFKDHGGHFAGSLDGVRVGVPDVPADTPCVLEIKTHGAKSYEKLVASGVRAAKPMHYSQMQTYMQQLELSHALYFAVRKDDDAIHLEIVDFDKAHADQMNKRAKTIILRKEPPNGVGTSPAWFECKWCPAVKVCHHGAPPEKNCRTCAHRLPSMGGGWDCSELGEQINDPLAGASCKWYERLF